MIETAAAKSLALISVRPHGNAAGFGNLFINLPDSVSNFQFIYPPALADRAGPVTTPLSPCGRPSEFSFGMLVQSSDSSVGRSS
jgi:hypothetical protein